MKILDILLESTTKIVVVGDSIAVGVASGFAGAIVDAKVGRSTQAIASAVTGNTNVQGADVAIVSAGTNDYPLANGGKNNNTQGTISNIQSIKNTLKAKKYIWILPFNKTAAQDVSSAIGNDAIINLSSVSSTQDKLHPTNYSPVIQAIKTQLGNVNTEIPVKPEGSQKVQPTNKKPGEDNMAHAGATQSLTVPKGRVNPEVADIQKTLIALGYQLPKHGVDGVRGPETTNAIRQFQIDHELKADGDPGPETIYALNHLIEKKNIKFVKSTEADVKKQNATAFTGNNPQPTLKMDSVTKGRVGEVLNFIAKYESAGYYDMMFGGKRYPEILKMTLREINAFQMKNPGSSAAGRYQIMHFNMKAYAQKAGLDFDKDLFSPENQDKMGIVFLRECGLQSWLAGKLSNERFLDKIAGVWAAFAKSDGTSPYNKVGLNGVGLNPKVSLAVLNDIQPTTA